VERGEFTLGEADTDGPTVTWFSKRNVSLAHIA
jgi:hypothetical protein